jgi:hypothetical protein
MPAQNSINQIVLQSIENLIPIQSNPNRRIIPVGNNEVFVISNHWLHIFDVDGTLIRRSNIQTL